MRPLLAIPLLLTAIVVGQTPPTVPSADDLRRLVAAGDWPAVLAGATRALALKGDAAGAYDRAELVQWKADAQLRTNQFRPAADTLDRAARQPACAPADADRFRAWAMLYRHSDPRGYKPPATRTDPRPAAHPVTEPADRAKALAVFCDVQLAAAAGRLNAIGDQTVFEKTIELAHDLIDLAALERTVRGQATATEATLTALQAKAVARIGGWIRDSSSFVERCAADAEAVKRSGGKDIRTGLSNSQRQGLIAVTAGCARWQGYHRALVDALAGRASAALLRLPTDLTTLARRVPQVQAMDRRSH